jgi:tRNA A-37 threonylcarbamoyl transferase component Bud32
MPRNTDHDDPIDDIDDDDPFLKPGGAFDGPLWQELLSEPCELDTGARLGPYEIRAPIAAGGMGEVYKAFDTRLAREVALKVLPRHSLDSPEAMKRFQREVRAVAALNHPNILAIHDVGSEGDVHFAVTELLEGDTVRNKLAHGGAITPSKAIEYAAQIAHGLSAAHERGIIHRDLKPENVFVTNDGRIKILDFGIALHESQAESESTGVLTQTGMIVGTVGYVSPEQVLGNPATAKSDLFALGVVIYEMLTATNPFRRETTPETHTAILREDPPSLARTVPGLPPPVARMIDLCLQKHASDRPESARDLALFLEVSNAGSSAWHAPAVSEDAPPAPLAAPSLPWRAWTAAACGFLVLLTLATWGYVRVVEGQNVDALFESDFARAARGVARLHREHLDRLSLTARLVAAFPELKALLSTDAATVEDFLLGFQQRFPRTPLLVALGRDGNVIGRTDTPGSSADAARDDWLAAINTGDSEGTMITVGTRPYLAVGVPSEAAGTIFGYIVAAESINQTYAESLSEATQSDVLLLSDESVLASTLRAGQTPWTSLQDWQGQGGSSDQFLNVQIGTQRYAARAVPLSNSPAVSAILVKSRDDAGASYAGIERGVLGIGIAATLLVLLAGLWWSRRAKAA